MKKIIYYDYFLLQIVQYDLKIVTCDLASSVYEQKNCHFMTNSIVVRCKWTEYMQDFLQNPSQHIYERSYRFKNIKGEQVILKNRSDKDILVQNLIRENMIVKNRFNQLKQNSYKILGDILGNYQIKKTNSSGMDQILSMINDLSSVSRYSATREACSKINSVLTELTIQYTSILIHHLLIAGSNIKTDKSQNDELNFISFRVSDLLRSKIQCKQNQFSNLLDTMYILDQSRKMQGKFKIVRIKNRLDTNANDIMVNYLFMDTILCEMQISIQQPQAKQKKYYTFSHFVYQLTRGKFGSIAQCAIMVSQLDNMIVAQKGGRYYQEKTQNKKQYQFNFDKPNKVADEINVYECSLCKQLIINEVDTVFMNEIEHKRTCQTCILKQDNPEKFIKDTQIRNKLSSLVDDKKLTRIKSYGQLKDKSNRIVYLAIMNRNTGQIDFGITVFSKDERATFKLRSNYKFILQMQQNNFDYTKFNYINITSAIKKDKFFEGLMYQWEPKDASQTLRQLLQIDEGSQIQTKIQENILHFLTFRRQKKLIKSIKRNNDVLDLSESKQMQQAFNSIVDEIINNKNKTPNFEKVKYKKVHKMTLKNIKKIQAQGLQASKVIQLGSRSEMPNLKTFNFASNLMPKIELNNWNQLTKLNLQCSKNTEVKLSDMKSLTEVNLSDNQLTTLTLTDLKALTQLLLRRNYNLAHVQLMNLNSLTKLEPTQKTLQHAILNNLPLIKVLNFNNNGLKKGEFVNLKGLQDLYLSHNQLQQVKFEKLPALKSLFLYENSLTNVQLSKLSALQSVDLDSNQLTQVQVTELPKLISIDLRRNKLTSVNLSKVDCLQKIYLHQNELKQFKLNNLPALKELTLNSNQLTSYQLTGADRLQSLSLHYNNFTQFKLNNHPSLQTLSLNNNKDLRQVQLCDLKCLHTLNLRQNKLTKAKIKNLPALKSLNLYDSRLTSVQLSGLSAVQSMDLDSNLFTQIQLNDFASLRSLDLRRNQLTSVNLSKMDYLQTLHLQQNKLKQFKLRNFAVLKQVTLNNNKLNQTFELSNLPCLESIDLSSNQIGLFKSSNTPALKSLNLGNNHLKSFQLSTENSLKTLQLNNNKLSKFKAQNHPTLEFISLSKNENLAQIQILDMTCLTNLNLSQNKLSKGILKNLSALQQVDLSNNQQHLQLEISQIQKIKRLNLQSIKLTRISLKQLPALERLDLNNNQLSSIQLNDLNNLENLHLQNNKLVQFKYNHLPKLQQLYLSSNQLSVCQLTNMNSLRVIQLQENQLTKIKVSKLEALYLLKLDKNKLQSIDLGQLVALKYLYISENNLSSLKLANISTLTRLNVLKNSHKIQALQLPASLEQLQVDFQNIQSYDFARMVNLRSIKIEKQVAADKFKNIKKQVSINFDGQQ